MEEIKNIRVSELRDFKNHPFHVQQDMELCALMKSIEDEGVIVPLLVRPNPDGEGYEVIAGHRRKAAAQWAGLAEVPAVIRELDDNQAIVAMVDSNLQRENLKPSEKAFAYKMKLEGMNRQGRKTDITSAQVGPKPERSNELLARQMARTYTEKDGFLYPNLSMEQEPEQITVGKYGLLWTSYMKETYPDRYRHHIRMGQLYSKAAEVNEEAYQMVDTITNQYLMKHKLVNPASTMEMWKLREQAKQTAEEEVYETVIYRFY